MSGAPARAALVLACALAAPARAQNFQEPPPITPDLALLAAHQAYTGAPVADHMQVRLNGARSWLTIRIAPGRAADLSDVVVGLELGDLRLHVMGGLLTAENIRAPDVYYQVEIEGVTPEALARVLPPIPVPQLVLAAGAGGGAGGRGGDDLTPYTTDVRWTTAAWDDQAGVVRLEGAAAQGAVTLELDRHSGRFRHLRAETEAGLLELIAEAVEPDDPATWPIDTDGRERVERLSALTERARPVRVGEQIQDLPMLNTAGDVRPLSSLFQHGPVEWVEAGNKRVLLILAPLDGLHVETGAGDPEAFVRATLAGVDVLTDEADAGQSVLCPFAAHLVLFVRSSGFEQEAAEAAAQALEVPAERLLWSPMEPVRLEGVDAGRPAALVVDSQRRVVAIFGAEVIKGDAVDTAAILRPALDCSARE